MEYKIVRSAKRRTVGISINSSREICIKVPSRLAMYKVEAIIAEKRNWIETKIKELDAKGFFARTGKKFENNEEFCFLGKKYRLIITPHAKNSVEIMGGEIRLYKKETAHAKVVLMKFFLEQAHKIFAQRMSICFEHFSHFFLCPYPVVCLRKMKARWGSCSSKGVVTLNSLLIHTSIECIDYVIFHELCHLKHRNHSMDFYSLQSRVNPKWKQDKSSLESFMGEVASLG